MPKKRRLESNKGNSVGDIMSSLQQALSEREKELDAREEKLREEQERFEAERAKDYGRTEPSDVLHLNIGGTKTVVLRRTLTSVPGSMLASKFSGRWDDSLEKDKDGDFFIDQNYSLFKYIIEYLRNKANETEEYAVMSPNILRDMNTSNYDDDAQRNRDKVRDFYRMVEYYGITNGIYPTKLISSASDDSLEILGDKKVNAKEWTTFILKRDGHERKVKTYEVTLGSAQRVHIGWGPDEQIWKYHKNKGCGVGGIQDSVGLDLTRSLFLSSGKETPIDGLEHPPGTVVRSENYGEKWYVNGERLNHTFPRFNRSSNYPTLSVKGEFEITLVQLDSRIEY